MMPEAAFDLNAPDHSIRCDPGASDVLHPDGHAADASFPPFIDLVDGSGVVGYCGYAHEGEENPSLEELIAGPEKEVHQEQAMDPRDNDGLAASNAEDQLPQSADKTLPIVDVVARDEAPAFPEPPPVPESFPRDPVPQGGKGEGWPYAPQGWPRPEDKWGWRVGQRAGANSLWIDRYVFLPASLMKGKRVNNDQFASKKSLVEYVKHAFPQVKDPSSILKAFDWKVPAPKSLETPEKRGLSVKRDKTSPTNGDDDWQRSKKQCRAGNPHCPLTKGKFNEAESLERLFCHICCTEPDFCRECKCVLCCKPFAPDADDFSVIRCLNAPLLGSSSRPSARVCGHAAHLECALNSQLAGVIKRRKVHLEYVCRRCDRKTSLKETLSRLVLDFMTANEIKSQSTLQLLLRVVHDPGDEPDSSEKIYVIFVQAFKKVQDGADIVTSCKELTEQLLEFLQTGQGVYDNHVLHHLSNWSQGKARKHAFQDHTTRSHEAQPVDSPDSAAFMVQVYHKSPPAQSSPSLIEPNGIIVPEVCEGNARVEPGLKKSSLKPDNLLMPFPLSWSLPRLLDESVCKPPTLSIEEHIRQCEAMTDRVKGAGTFGNVDPKPPSFLAIDYQVASPTPSHDAEIDSSSEPVAKIMEVEPLQMREVPPSQGVNIQQCEAMTGAGTSGNADPEPPNFLAIQYQVASPTPSHDAEEDRSPDAVAKSMEKSPPRSADSDVDMEVISLQMREVPPSKDFEESEIKQALDSEYEAKVRQALRRLKRAQAAEYAYAEEALQAQKKVVLERYLQLEKVGSRFGKKRKSKEKGKAVYDRDIHRLTAQYAKAQEGLTVFESMLAISSGFGLVSEDFLREFFKWSVPSDITEA